MLPVLPREMLWTEKESMDEFFQLDPINEDFYEVFTTLSNEPFSVTKDAVKIFNEVYYQMTRMLYEHPMPNELEKYVADVKANLGWSYCATLVMSMIYFLNYLRDNNRQPLNRFFVKSIRENFGGPMYWLPIKQRAEKLKRANKKCIYVFRPHPREVESFQDLYINWKVITNNYDLGSIDHVINLWGDSEDKIQAAQIIKDSLSYGVNLKKYAYDQQQVCRFIDRVIADYSTPVAREADVPSLFPSMKDRLEQVEKENYMLHCQNDELVEENQRLKTLLETKKNRGEARKFTLVEIVNYCKNGVEWNDAKEIEAMLYKLLYNNGTQEDRKLVDSIGEEFKRRKYGNTFENANVTMQQPTINGPINEIHGNDNVSLGGK